MRQIYCWLIKKILWGCFFILLIGVLAVTTETGTRMTLRAAAFFSKGHLAIGAVQGRLIDTWSLQQVAYTSPRFEIKIKTLQLHWKIHALLKSALSIDSIDVQDVVIQTHPPVATQKTVQSEKPSTGQHSFPFSLQIERFTLQNLKLFYDAAQKPFVLEQLNAQIALGERIAVQADARLRAPIPAHAKLAVLGAPSQYRLSLAVQGTDIDWLVYGEGGKEKLQLQTAKSQLLQGKFFSSGSLQWSPQYQWDFSLRAAAIDLSKLYPKAPRSLSFFAKTRGGVEGGTLKIEKLYAMQNGLPLEGHIDLEAKKKNTSSVQNKTTLFQKFGFKIQTYIRWGKSTLTLQGGLSDLWNMRYVLHVPDLHSFSPPIAGGVRLTGVLTGSAANPFFNADFYIPSLRSGDTTQLPWIENVQGKWSVKLQLDQAEKKGNMQIESSVVHTPYLGLQLKNISLHAEMKNKIIQYAGTLFSGPGQLRLTGNTALENKNKDSFFSLTGSQFLIKNTPRFKIYVSPQLHITQQNKLWEIKGTVDVPLAEIKLPNMETTVTLPKETRVVRNAQETVQEKNGSVYSNVLLTLGEKVHVQTGGLDSFIGGKLYLEDQPKKETLAEGHLKLLHGSYALQGQKLEITRGDVAFMHAPLTNPSLQLRAAKTILYTTSNQTYPQNQNLLVGVDVSGTAENPHVTLFSDPAGWSQADILSLIVLGKPASAASEANVQSLLAAASLLTPQGSMGVGNLMTQLQDTFGLSELKLESSLQESRGTNKQTTSFVMGKYISPRLYLNYSLDVLNAMHILRLRYLLTQSWSIQSQASPSGTGIDVLYHVDRE